MGYNHPHLQHHLCMGDICRHQTATNPHPRPSAEQTLCSGQGVTMRIAAAPRLSLTTCSPSHMEHFHPHHVRPLWVTTVEVGHPSTTHHMSATAISHDRIYAHKPPTCRPTAQAHPTVPPSLPHNLTLLQQPRRATKTTQQVGFSHNKAFLLSQPYLHQSIHSTRAPRCLETKRINTTMALPARLQ
jgi:hypothetical protein